MKLLNSTAAEMVNKERDLGLTNLHDAACRPDECSRCARRQLPALLLPFRVIFPLDQIADLNVSCCHDS